MEDVLQEALLAIHTRRHTHDREIPVTAWAYAIARYKLIDFLRIARRSDAEISIDSIPDIVGDDGVQSEAAVVVHKILATLPERFRVPIELTKIDGLSVMETAARIGISEAAIKVNVHRGLKMLSRMLR